MFFSLPDINSGCAGMIKRRRQCRIPTIDRSRDTALPSPLYFCVGTRHCRVPTRDLCISSRKRLRGGQSNHRWDGDLARRTQSDRP